MHLYRSALLRFTDDGQAVYEEMVCWPSVPMPMPPACAGCWRFRQQLSPQFAGQPSRLAGAHHCAGFVDMHIHYPRRDVVGSPAEGLLPWLENYTFRTKRFVAHGYSEQVAHFFCDELLRNGVTTALAFATSHPQSVDALFTEARHRQLRLITGKVPAG